VEPRVIAENTPCNLNSIIKCTNCGTTYTVGELEKNTDNPNLYFCDCDSVHPLVQDAGDGNLFAISGAHAQLF
jgi:hypothetical protein